MVGSIGSDSAAATLVAKNGWPNCNLKFSGGIFHGAPRGGQKCESFVYCLKFLSDRRKGSGGQTA